MPGTRTKDQLTQDELDEYTRVMKALHDAEPQYNLSADQIKASLLALSIVLDMDLEVLMQDYQLLTDQDIIQ